MRIVSIFPARGSNNDECWGWSAIENLHGMKRRYREELSGSPPACVQSSSSFGVFRALTKEAASGGIEDKPPSGEGF
jgi:hypothetical protein